MLSDITKKPLTPPPPMSPWMRAAMILELAMVTNLFAGLPHWSCIVGLIFCVPYSHFSATRAAFKDYE